MTNATKNPILIFIHHLVEAIQVLSNQFYTKLNSISWGKFFLYSFFTLLAGSILCLGSIAWLGVLSSFFIKCFFGHEDQVNKINEQNKSNAEE